MATTTFGRAAHVTRRAATAATAATSFKFIGGTLVAGWAAVAANSFHILGGPMPLEQLVVALSALITGTVTLALWRLLGGAVLFRAFHEGFIAKEREAQRRGERIDPGMR